jgi:cyclophilin family peptidyl-prolyl cis-trans isomerase
LAAVLVFVLGGCGSGSSKSTSTASDSASANVASSRANGCQTVSTPAPKGNLHIPSPTLKLDPSKRYVVSLATNCGNIEIELDVKRAPKISASFVYLVKRGFYDDLTFHRVVAGFVIQGGDPDGNGSGGPGYTVVEQPPSDLQYTRGVVAMAKTNTDPPGTSGSQFFIVTGANVGLPAQYALLGQVVGGQSTVSKISNVATKAGPDGEESTPSIPIVISHATLSSN